MISNISSRKGKTLFFWEESEEDEEGVAVGDYQNMFETPKLICQKCKFVDQLGLGSIEAVPFYVSLSKKLFKNDFRDTAFDVAVAYGNARGAKRGKDPSAKAHDPAKSSWICVIQSKAQALLLSEI